MSGEMLTNLSLVLVTHLSVPINSKFSLVWGLHRQKGDNDTEENQS